MAGTLGLLVCIGVWALLFKPFFSNRAGFIYSAKCAFWSGGRYLHWAWNNELEINVRSAVKFYVWFALGGSSGYLIKTIVENI